MIFTECSGAYDKTIKVFQLPYSHDQFHDLYTFAVFIRKDEGDLVLSCRLSVSAEQLKDGIVA